MAASFGLLLAFASPAHGQTTAVTKTKVVGDWVCVDLEGETRKESTEARFGFINNAAKNWLGSEAGACSEERIAELGLRSIYGLTAETRTESGGTYSCAYFAPIYVEVQAESSIAWVNLRAGIAYIYGDGKWECDHERGGIHSAEQSAMPAVGGSIVIMTEEIPVEV